MSSLKQNILLIGSWDRELIEAGAAIVPGTAQALAHSNKSWDVVGVTATVIMESKFPALHGEIRRTTPWTRFVAALPEGLPIAHLLELHHRYQLERVVETTKKDEVEAVLYAAQEEAQRQRQYTDIEMLFREQERRLEDLRRELELRVEKRTRMLAESRHNLHLRNRRLEIMANALMAVQEASSVPEMEKLLGETLGTALDISWIRVIPGHRDSEFERQLDRMEGFAWKSIPLWRNQDRIGSVFFMRPQSHPFRKDDIDFFNKVSEAVSLALDRITKFRETETVKEQWDATFSAIASPMALIDDKDRVLQANIANPESAPCYRLLFGRSEPCPDCGRGKSFRLRHQGRDYDVHSQPLVLQAGEAPVFAHLYSDVTERLRVESRIVESTKMAELGTIGSSIAHELNNPIGGILNFAQLLKMELPPDHALRPDLDAIEDGARRCKEIVENLLGFTRRSPGSSSEVSDLREVVARAIKLADLRARPLGVKIQFAAPPIETPVRGSTNLLAHAVRNLIDRSMDFLLDARNGDVVQIRMSENPDEISLLISDSGSPEAGRPTLALQIAEQILREAGATIQINGPSSPDPRAKISFSRPVLRS